MRIGISDCCELMLWRVLGQCVRGGVGGCRRVRWCQCAGLRGEEGRSSSSVCSVSGTDNFQQAAGDPDL